MKRQSRSATIATLATWRALFLREAVNRLSSGRTAWVWILFEPLSHILFLIFMFTAIRVHTVGGIDTAIWVMIGMLTFFIFRRSANQAINAITANKALFSYRQVKPVDTVIVRVAVEGFLMVLVAIILFVLAALLGHSVMPADPLAVLEGVFGVWLLGLGFGLIASVAVELVQEMEAIIGLIMMPLYFISGVIFPITAIPPEYREYLLFNPLVHGIESTRLGFAPYYHTVDLSIAYLYGCACVLLFFGLALHARFASRMVAQ